MMRFLAILFLLILTDGHDVIGCRLVDEVVEPVAEQQMSMSTPADNGLLGVVIVGEIICGRIDGQSQVLVPDVLPVQGVGVVLRVSGDENLPSLLVHDAVDASLIRGGHDLQSLGGSDVLPEDGGVAGMGNPEFIVKATQQDGALVVRPMGEYAEELLLQLVLGNAVVIVKARLGAPADVEGGMDIGLAPLHDPAQLRPVVHRFKLHQLHRCAGDDHAVEFAILQLIEGLVEGQKMLRGHILGLVGGHLHELQMHLQRGVAQESGELGLRNDLGGHQIQHHDLKRSDLLGFCPGLVHDEDIFFFQGLRGREVIGDLNGHIAASLVVDFFIFGSSTGVHGQQLDPLPKGLRIRQVHEEPAGCVAVFAVPVDGVIDVDVAGVEEPIQQTVMGTGCFIRTFRVRFAFILHFI